MSHKSAPASASSAADPRVRKSAQALGSALLLLLETKPLEQITIREIAAGADVHYATFFRHYPTKEALLDHVAADQIRRLVQLTLPLLDSADSESAFLALCIYVEDHRALWTALLTGGAAGAMREELLRVSTGLADAQALEPSWLPVELAVSCTVGLIIETLTWWLRQPAGQCSPAEVSVILHRLVLSSTMTGEITAAPLAPGHAA